MQPGDQYQQTQFNQLPNNSRYSHTSSTSSIQNNMQFRKMSKKQQTQLLYSIKIHATETQNLLDLTCEQTNPRTSCIFTPAYYREFIQDRIIEISGPITIQDGYVTSYKLYKIKSKKKNQQEFDTVVERRFSDFEYLYEKLMENYGGCLIPTLPQKSIWASLNMQTIQYIKNRRQRLQKFIQKILAHKKLRYAQQFLYFLFDPQNNFSQKKGQHYSTLTLQDNIYKITNDALETGYHIIKQYIPNQYIPQILQHKVINNRQDNQILHYQIIVNGLTDVINQIKIIVQNTCQEDENVEEFNQICEMLGAEDQEVKDSQKNGKSKKEKSGGKEVTRIYDRYTKQIQVITVEKVGKYAHLLESYQNIFQFIQSCKQAIMRRKKLGQYLQSLRQQYDQLQVKSRHNPRNINLDILRSKIQQTNKKYQQFTQQLMQQLQAQVIMGKDMVASFVQQLVNARKQIYQE